MSNLYIDYGYCYIPHDNEEICGDQIVVKNAHDDLLVGVLADGLGSGVKANILANLTATMLTTMIENNMALDESIHTIATTLPVCKVRNLAYSTFTLITILNQSLMELYQYDNPQAIVLRDGILYPYEIQTLSIDGKNILYSKISLELNDTIIIFSDGITHAGVGNIYHFGWNHQAITEFIEKNYFTNLSSRAISTMILNKTMDLYENKPMDDLSVLTLKIKNRFQVNLLVGPPTKKADDSIMLSLFMSKNGRHIVCGGTTANIVSHYLNQPIQLNTDFADSEIPPTAEIEGIDLVTEGVITLAKVLKNAKNYLLDNTKYNEWKYQNDGASQISVYLFEEATDINFYCGCAVNPAHQNVDLPITFSIKMQLVNELSECLKQMGKNIKVSYF